MTDSVVTAKTRIARWGSGLHWAHWAIVITSLVVTVFASWFAASSARARHRAAFDHNAEQVLSLIRERLGRYETGLLAGVGVVQSFGDGRELTRTDWRRFADNIDLPGRFPGINGIGVIYHVRDAELAAFEARISEELPEVGGFRAHPELAVEDHFPITYIEPLSGNEQAVGLDMAFEPARHAALLRTIGTGKPQITAPIVLVQDDGKTPGFLFYAPFFRQLGGARTMESFVGVVYAPFVVKRLMAGTLAAATRSVAVEITEGNALLYSEGDAAEEPAFRMARELPLYGRTWRFDIRSTPELDQQGSQLQALTILVGGITIDGLLFGIFVLLSRSRNRAERLAEQRTEELEQAISALEYSNSALSESNRDLEQFAFIASHDLQSPIRTVGSFGKILKADASARLTEEELGLLDTMIRSADRMKELVASVLEYSRLEQADHTEQTHLGEIFSDIAWELQDDIRRHGVKLTIEELPTLDCEPASMAMLARNLIGNAIKFRRQDVPLEIQVDACRIDEGWQVRVADNGIGIDPEDRSRVFEVFKRLHRREKIPGSGIGLSICEKVARQHGGRIRVEARPEGGSVFVIDLPLKKADVREPRSITPG